MCCLLEELSKYKQIRKCNVASFEKEKKQLRKCDVASCKKNATQKMQLWKLHFFAFSVAFVLMPLHFCLHFFRIFFRKKIQKLIKVAKKMQRRKCNVASCKKMQRRKCNVGSCIFFAFSVPDELFMYVSYFCFSLPICLSLDPTAQPFIATLPITSISFNPLRFPCMLTPLHPFVP